MKPYLRRPLLGAASLILTVGWSGLALTGQPELPTASREPIAPFQQQNPVARPAPLDPSIAEGGIRPGGNGPHQDGDAAGFMLRPSGPPDLEQELLAKASFPEGQGGDSRWLDGRLQRLKSHGPEGKAGGRAASEPLGLFLLGTGMFGLAAFKRKCRR